MKINKYKIGFDIWGMILFLLIMVPNFIWFRVPAPNDILRNESVTPVIDTVASVCQIFMVIALCIIINTEAKKHIEKKLLVGIAISTILYFAGWIFYYQGLTNPLVILDLCIALCVSFMLFSIARKNVAASALLIIFTICHVMYGVINFTL